MHAHDIAVAMSIKEIVVPRSPGIVCAQGLVIAEVKEDFTGGARTTIGEVIPPSIKDTVTDLKSRAGTWAKSENLKDSQLLYDLGFDMRYVGQNFELSVPISSGAILDPARLPDATRLKKLFFEAHELAYSFHDPFAKVELLHVRLTVRAPLFKAADKPPAQSRAALLLPVGKRAVYFNAENSITTPVYKREDFSVGTQLTGPAIIDQIDTSIPIFPGDRLTVHASGNLIIEVKKWG
jgi:N-methylhydantoinase A